MISLLLALNFIWYILSRILPIFNTAISLWSSLRSNLNKPRWKLVTTETADKVTNDQLQAWKCPNKLTVLCWWLSLPKTILARANFSICLFKLLPFFALCLFFNFAFFTYAFFHLSPFVFFQILLFFQVCLLLTFVVATCAIEEGNWCRECTIFSGYVVYWKWIKWYRLKAQYNFLGQQRRTAVIIYHSSLDVERDFLRSLSDISIRDQSS